MQMLCKRLELWLNLTSLGFGRKRRERIVIAAMAVIGLQEEAVMMVLRDNLV
jgi:hypothetical protein